MKLDETYATACRERLRQHIDSLSLYPTVSEIHPLSNPTTGHNTTNISVVGMDVISATIATHKAHSGTIGVLNFASYTTPGGGFINNKYAQEEAICYCTNLYDELSKHRDWYNHPKNYGLYANDSILSHCIAVVASDMDKFLLPEEVFYISVLTCAAPHMSTIERYRPNLEHEAHVAARSRAKYVVNVFARSRFETIILGAFGCGVFGNYPDEIAQAFKEAIADNPGCFSNVVFAIPKSDRDSNYEEFAKVFNNSTGV